MTVRARFAPSPTGMLHIGGARTALFNFLFARHHGGQFLLRIEDTDRARSTDAAVQAIIDGLTWIGVTPDAPPIFQFPRAPRHAEVAQQMLADGTAYRCWLTADELKAMREANPNAKIRSPWRDRDPAEGPQDVAPAIRLKAPREGETVVDDLVQGTVRVANAELDDMIILRSDGTPTYQHAVVVDDHDMEITHVIRGDDHLTNTFRQAQIYDAMGWPRPRFAHVPLIHGADGHKLSKRHGAVSVLEFQEQGYLPEAVCNYLMRLGWAHGDLEVISREEAIRVFDVDGINRGAARMDYAKLQHINGVWIRAADDARLTRLVLERLAKRPGLALGTDAAHRIAALMPELKQRAKTLIDLADAASFLAHPAARLRAQGRSRPDTGGPHHAARLRRRPGRHRLQPRGDRRRPAQLRRNQGPEARPGRPAAARRAHRHAGEPGDRRDPGGTWPRRGAGAHRGGGGVAMFSTVQINLYCADVPRALAFYAGLLGGTESYRFPRDGDPEHVELNFGAARIALTSAAGLVSHRLPPATPGTPFEIAIRAEHADTAVARLREAGVPVMIEPFDSPAGNRVAYVADPDGNRVQLWSRSR